VADKFYLSNVLKERAFRDFGEELDMYMIYNHTYMINIPNLKL